MSEWGASPHINGLGLGGREVTRKRAVTQVLKEGRTCRSLDLKATVFSRTALQESTKRNSNGFDLGVS
jgi:hypothetical protein